MPLFQNQYVWIQTQYKSLVVVGRPHRHSGCFQNTASRCVYLWLPVQWRPVIPPHTNRHSAHCDRYSFLKGRGTEEATLFTLPIVAACPTRHLYFRTSIANFLSASRQLQGGCPINPFLQSARNKDISTLLTISHNSLLHRFAESLELQRFYASPSHLGLALFPQVSSPHTYTLHIYRSIFLPFLPGGGEAFV